jgi:hypothetical protein
MEHALGTGGVLGRHQLERRAALEPLRRPSHHAAHRRVVVNDDAARINNRDRLAGMLDQRPV